MKRTSSSSSSDSDRSTPAYQRSPRYVKSSKRKGNRDTMRIVVIGDQCVGKSALTVRLLTRRFIGTYQNEKDMLYKTADIIKCEETNNPIKLEIYDTTLSQFADDDTPNAAITERLYWSTAVVIVYDITNSDSFKHAREALSLIKRERPQLPCLLMANKTDLEHLQSVNDSEIISTCDKYTNCLHAEVSAATSEYSSILEPVQKLFTTCQNVVTKVTVKRRKSFVDMAKSFSNLLRSGSSRNSESKTSS